MGSVLHCKDGSVSCRYPILSHTSKMGVYPHLRSYFFSISAISIIEPREMGSCDNLSDIPLYANNLVYQDHNTKS